MWLLLGVAIGWALCKKWGHCLNWGKDSPSVRYGYRFRRDGVLFPPPDYFADHSLYWGRCWLTLRIPRRWRDWED